MKSRSVVVRLGAVCALMVLVGLAVLLLQHAAPTAPTHAPVVPSQRVEVTGPRIRGSIAHSSLPDVPENAYGPALQSARVALDERRYDDVIAAASRVWKQRDVDARTAALADLLAAIAYVAQGQYDEALERSQDAAARSAKVQNCGWLRASAEFWALAAGAVRPHAAFTEQDAEALMAVASRYPEYQSAERAMNLIRQSADKPSSGPVDPKITAALSAMSERRWATPTGKANAAFALYTLSDLYRQHGIWRDAIAVTRKARQQFPDSDLSKNSDAMIKDAEVRIKMQQHVVPPAAR
jgi:tetratricopeptide (TPR) repeat protein